MPVSTAYKAILPHHKKRVSQWTKILKKWHLVHEIVTRFRWLSMIHAGGEQFPAVLKGHWISIHWAQAVVSPVPWVRFDFIEVHYEEWGSHGSAPTGEYPRHVMTSSDTSTSDLSLKGLIFAFISGTGKFILAMRYCAQMHCVHHAQLVMSSLLNRDIRYSIFGTL